MHPLTILAVGLYGEVLPNQNGAPLRLVVPWKYGFKSIKSIVKIRLVEQQPVGSWELAAHRSMAFTPTSIRMYRIRAGVRRVNGGSVSFPNVKHSVQRLCRPSRATVCHGPEKVLLAQKRQ